MFQRNVLASGVIPQDIPDHGALRRRCSLFHRPSPDFIFYGAKHSYMSVTGPEVVKTVTHDQVTAEELGGAGVHTGKIRGCRPRPWKMMWMHSSCCVDSSIFFQQQSGATPWSGPTNDPPDRTDHFLGHPGTGIDPNVPYDIAGNCS